MSRVNLEVYNPWKILAAVRVGSKVRVRNRGKCQEDASVTKTHCALTLALLSHPRHAASASPFDSELQTQTTIRSSRSPGVMSGMNGRMVKGQLLPMNRGSRTQRLNLLLGGLSFERTSAQHDGNVSQKPTIMYFLFPACEV